MPRSSRSFVHHLIERLDRLDPNSVQGYILRLVREKGVLESVFQTIREGIIIINRDLRIEFVNRAAMNLLGLPANILDAPGHKINRFLRDLDWDRLMRLESAEWERVSRQEIEVVYPQHRVLLFYLLPYKNQFDPASKLGLAVIILHDVTDLREQTATQIEAGRLNAITMLAAGVAHEIGNPLNSLNIHLQLLDRHFRDQPPSAATTEARELLAVPLDEVKRLDRIIGNFLKAVRPTPVELKPVALKDVVNDTLRAMKGEIEDHELTVQCEWGVDVPPVAADRHQLQQALHNILKNSIQAMASGGTLRIALTADADAVSLAVNDTGKGIAPEDLGNIFNPYYTTRENGTGLGLVIVERIVREHGATLGVDSEPGRGTTFTVRFPLRERRLRLLEAPDDRKLLRKRSSPDQKTP